MEIVLLAVHQLPAAILTAKEPINKEFAQAATLDTTSVKA